MIGRRSFVYGSAASLGFFSLGGCGETPPLPPINTARILDRPIIDAHVHVFNAKDLPSFQFLAQVYVEPLLGALSWPALLLLMAMVHHVEEDAPDDAEEREAMLRQPKPRPSTEDLVTRSLLTLEEGSLPVRATNVPPPVPPRPTASRAPAAARLAVDNVRPETPSPETQRAAFAILAGRAAAPPAPAAPGPAPRGISAAPTSVDRVARARQIAARLLAAPDSKAGPARSAPAASAAPGEYEPPGELQQTLNWFQEFTQYRAQRIDAWKRSIGGTGNRFCMPGLVDFGFSLRGVDETDVPLANQVRLMGELSRRQERGRLVHGYVAFNPLRYALRGRQALDLVKEAIEEHGFLGVKLYPPMGFRASGNVGAKPNLDDLLRYLGRPYTNDPVGFTRRVDEGLGLIFDYCATMQAVVMAHSGPSNLAHHAYDDRPNPTYWREVLRQRPTLRVNFGHFGGAWEKSDVNGRRDYAWARGIIRLFADYPNVYGDFADYELVLKPGADEMADLAAFLKSLDPAEKALMRKRLLFGSDWEMLGRVPEHYLFASKMLQFMADTLGGSIDDYAALNALRFIGLDDESGPATRRLVKFHQQTSVNGATLDAFRKLVRRRRA